MRLHKIPVSYRLIIVAGVLALALVAQQLISASIFAKAMVLNVVPSTPAPIKSTVTPVVIPDFSDPYYALVRNDIEARCGQSRYHENEVLNLAYCLRRESKGKHFNTMPVDFLGFFDESVVKPRPVACAAFVNLYRTALTSLGYWSRAIDLSKPVSNRLYANFRNSTDNSIFDRHQALEVFEPSSKSWVYVDAWFGLVVRGTNEKRLLSAFEIQNSRPGDVVLERFHEFHRPYSAEEYLAYFDQVAINYQMDPQRRFHPIRDEYGPAYRSFRVRFRNPDACSRCNWEFKDSWDEDTENQILEYFAGKTAQSHE